jgi:hypothetical protein
MMKSIQRKWMFLIAGCGFLLQATAGCPNDAAVRGVFSTSAQSLVTGILGLYIKAGTNQFFNV